MPSAPKRRHKQRINIAQFVVFFVALALIGSLLGILAAGTAIPAIGALGAVARAVPDTFHELPTDIEVVQPSETSQMLDSEGRVLANFFSERRNVVTSEQIAPIMKDAIIAIEDWRFFTHHGIDPEGMLRAVVSNLTTGGQQGASTITQQYVKNMLMEQGIQAGDQDMIEQAQEVSIERKLREARYAVSLETQMTKDQILTGYLNLATFGANLYGVEAASRAYFSKSASELTPAEAALLAGIVKSPVDLDPLVNPEAAEDRRDLVLTEMERRGYLTKAEMREAKAIPVEEMLNPQNMISGCARAGTSAYFCEYVLAEFLADEAYGPDRAARERLLNTGGLTLRTSINAAMQDAAYQSVVAHVPVDDPSGLNAALVSTEPSTGQIKAMAQNTPFGIATESQPNATPVSFTVDEKHGGGVGFQTGSTFKVFTLVEWFYEGHSAYEAVGRANHVFEPYSFSCGGTPIWTERWTAADLSGKEGQFDVIKATQLSANHAFGDMATKVDFCQIFQRAAEMGAVDGATGESIMPVGGNIIGSSNTTPLAMATAYSTLANDGVRCDPYGLIEVEDRTGAIMKSYGPSCTPVLSAFVAQQVTMVLEQTGAAYRTGIDRPIAAKTGTSDYGTNTWTAGFVPQLSAAVWVGFAKNSSQSPFGMTINGVYQPFVYGSTIAQPIWNQYIGTATAGMPVEGFPQVFLGNKPLPPVDPEKEKEKAETEGADSAEATQGTDQ